MIEFDPAKDAGNIAKHGMSLADAADMDLDKAVITVDDRFDYGEKRFVAHGSVGGVICSFVYTERDANIRAISLRAASKKEIARWQAEQ